ncbi:Ethanolamine kinase 1 [Paramyrothecium foliicola]|nr:Ethanolamine kinase 1 [Paramyrothecium foliicola]
MTLPTSNGNHAHIRFLPFSYDGSDSRASALKLVYALLPQWTKDEAHVDLVRFTDGITNTLLKVVNRRPGLSKADIDREAILLRAYGNCTDILIDREREAANHELLMKHGLAPELLARFDNGMLYRYISGSVAHPENLREPSIATAVARHLAQWHATVPCLPDQKHTNGRENGHSRHNGHDGTKTECAREVPGKLTPNLWTTLRKWILVLPTETEAQRHRRDQLETELECMIQQLSQRPGLGRDGLVFAHCDLLSANIIIHRDGGKEALAPTVSFIDYEYGTPSPAAFDVANHFAEWAGYECDYSVLPTRPQRQAFIHEYVATYFKLKGEVVDLKEEERKLMHEVDVFRGVPGFYWGIWALIQAKISTIDFDYASYAEERLGEYWSYKAEVDGTRAAAGKEVPLREKRWAEDQ